MVRFICLVTMPLCPAAGWPARPAPRGVPCRKFRRSIGNQAPHGRAGHCVHCPSAAKLPSPNDASSKAPPVAGAYASPRWSQPSWPTDRRCCLHLWPPKDHGRPRRVEHKLREIGRSTPVLAVRSSMRSSAAATSHEQSVRGRRPCRCWPDRAGTTHARASCSISPAGMSAARRRCAPPTATGP
jgi:hypothetical protein